MKEEADLYNRLRSRKKLERYLSDKSAKVKDFENKLFCNPKLIIESELDIHIPRFIDIAIWKETLNELFFVIPLKPYHNNF